MAGIWLRYLSFRASGEELEAVGPRSYLGPALVFTWLAGIGRYWDHPTAGPLQMSGAGSVVYVFVLGALLWAVLRPFGARGWTYLRAVTFVALTSPPALLYALPVERWVSLDRAIALNAQFLGVVAAWRVALLLFVLRRFARLTWPRALIGTLLPLTAIVFGLGALNLEQAVFEIMAGLHRRPPTPNDGAYLVVVVLSFLSFYALVPLVIAYAYLVWVARGE